MDNFYTALRKILIWIGFSKLANIRIEPANPGQTKKEFTKPSQTGDEIASYPRQPFFHLATSKYFKVPEEPEYYLSGAGDEKMMATVLDIISESPLPIRTREICEKLLEKIPGLSNLTVYHPHNDYVEGEILYHGWRQKWFIVKSIRDNHIDLLFSDGEQKKYAHGKFCVVDFPTKATDLFNKRVNNFLVSYWKNSDKLYNSKDKWHFHPFFYTDDVKVMPTLQNITPRIDDVTVVPTTPVIHRIVRKCEEFSKFSPEAIQTICDQYNIRYFFHITNIHNLPGILKFGLLSHNNCAHRKIFISDISNQDIQSARHTKVIPQYPELKVHDCVPLFIAPKSPMLSVLRDQQNDIIHLHISQQVLGLDKVIITDGNARSNLTRFYNRPADLALLDWDILKAGYWSSDDISIREENKRRRSAEVLVPHSIPLEYIVAISVYNVYIRAEVAKIVADHKYNIPVLCSPGLYF